MSGPTINCIPDPVIPWDIGFWVISLRFFVIYLHSRYSRRSSLRTRGPKGMSVDMPPNGLSLKSMGFLVRLSGLPQRLTSKLRLETDGRQSSMVTGYKAIFHQGWYQAAPRWGGWWWWRWGRVCDQWVWKSKGAKFKFMIFFFFLQSPKAFGSAFLAFEAKKALMIDCIVLKES